MGNWNTGGGGGGRGGSGAEVDRNMGIDRGDQGGNESRSSYDFDLNRAIREFRTGLPSLTRGEALQRANISPYRPSAVSFPQMEDGFIDVPNRNFNLNLEMRTPSYPMARVPTLLDKFKSFAKNPLNTALEKRTVMLDETGRAISPTYTITSENEIQDFLAGRINPFPFIKFDTRTATPLTSPEKYQVSSVSAPFAGTREMIVSYDELGTPTLNQDEFILPTAIASTPTQRRSLVPMGEYGVGRALDPSTAYNPFGLLS